jgi:hypothetical protein
MQTIRRTIKAIHAPSRRADLGDGGELADFPDEIDFSVGDELLIMINDEHPDGNQYFARYNITRQQGTIPLVSAAGAYIAFIFALAVLIYGILQASLVVSLILAAVFIALAVFFIKMYKFKKQTTIALEERFKEELAKEGITNPVVRFSTLRF